MAVPVHASSPRSDESSAFESLRLGERFEPRRALGRGGYGRVVLVHDRLRREDVALKILDERDTRSRADLKREFRVLKDVVHPNLVAMLELVLTDELECIALELVDGTDLLTHLRGATSSDQDAETHAATATRSTLTSDAPSHEREIVLPAVEIELQSAPLSRVATTFLQLLDALEALEAHDLVHGDLKPANVLVERGGRVVVLDFGIARLRGTTLRPVGTPAYMAPEQFARESTVAPATDRYSLGVMLHEALTGSLPFVGLPAQIMFAKLHGAPRPTPGPLGALAAALMSVDATARPSIAEIREVLGAFAPITHRHGTTRSLPFALRERTVVGRDRELAQLEAACGAVAPPIVLVRGAPGLGKTTLVDELARRRPTAVVRSRCYASETIRWNAIDAIVDAIVSDDAPLLAADPLQPITAAADRSALALLFPASRADASNEIAVDVLPMTELVRGAARALAAMITRRGASIVVIDDAQWADADSLGFLLELADIAPSLALVLTAREDDARTGQMLTRLGAGRREVTVISLAPLDAHDAASLVRARMGEGVDAERVAELTRGVPFLVEELAFALGLTGATTMDDAQRLVAARLADLPPLARHVLELLAVHAGPLDTAVLAEAVRSPHRVALRALATQRLTRVEHEAIATLERVDVYHDTIRQRVLGSIDPERRRSAHASLADALIALSGSAGEIAQHLLALDDTRAALWVSRAADAAEEVRALEQAATWVRRLVALTQDRAARHALRLRLAALLRRVEHHAESANELEHLAREQSGRDAIETRRQAAEQWLTAGELERGAAILRRLADEDTLEEAKLIRHTGLDLLLQRAKVRALGTAIGRSVAARVRPPRPLHHIDLAWTISGGFMLVDPTRAGAVGARLVSWARSVDDPERLLRALCGEAVYQGMFGELGRSASDGVLDEIDALRDRVDDHARAIADGTRGIVHIQRGEIARGMTALMPSLAALSRHHKTIGFELMSMRHFYTYGLYYMGRFDELERHVQTEYDDARRRGNPHRESDVCLNHATLAWLFRGGPTLARSRAASAMSFWSGLGPSVQRYYAVVSEVLTALWEGQAETLDAVAATAWTREVLHPVIAMAEGMRADLVHTVGRVHVARASIDPKPDTVARAFAWTSLLAADPAVHARPLATLQLAGLAAATGRTREADRLAARAAIALERCSLGGYARIARSVRDGRARDESVRPELVRVLAPGLEHR